MAGKLYGIGVGPGDPELMTLKAVKVIRQCDGIAVPGEDYETSVAYKIALEAVPELKKKEIQAIRMPMTKEKDVLEQSYREGAARLKVWLDQGKTVGFLTLGDVTIYSTYLYLHRLIRQAGYDTELVSGIPSFCAAAARMEMGLVEGAQELHIIPASYQIEESLSLEGTKVFMKSGKQIGRVKEQLKAAGMEAVMVERCGMEGEKLYHSLDEISDQAGYYSLIIAKETH
ncbi:MAG: precorrin-2 C(20)-methyltransferase [Lachnospiraceae bacterium]